MSFWGFIGILAILGIMFGGLFLSKRAQNQVEEQQRRKQRIRELRLALFDIDEILHTLLAYDRDVDLLEHLAFRMQALLDEGLIELPNDDELLKDKADLESIFAKINELKASPLAPAIPDSDRQIVLIKKHFHLAIKAIRKMQSNGSIDEISASNHKARLLKNALMIEVEAYCTQGHDAKAKGELNMAASFYKHAKELLTTSDLKFPEKMDHVKRISQEIHGVYVTLPNDEADEKNKK